jgi:ribosomal protein S6--L-glutamate ligase
VTRATILGTPSLTNLRLAAAFRREGFAAALAGPEEPVEAGPGDVVLARLDVLPTLDGVQPGLRALEALRRAGARLLNGPAALLNAHDKLATAILLARAGVRHPRTAHVRGPAVPETLRPPFVVKPRFGSWGRDVFLCETRDELAACFRRLARRSWVRRQGVLVQELVLPTGADLRLVVAAGEVVAAVERVAPAGEWRTNVALGATRRPAAPSAGACALAVAGVEAVGLDLAGVDLLAAEEGGHVVLEVNGAVDFTQEYGLDGADPFAAVAAALTGAPPAPALALAR